MSKTNQKKTRKKVKQDLCRSLKQGALLYLDGQLASPALISQKMLKEESAYMADYVTDEEGRIREIRYDRIVM